MKKVSVNVMWALALKPPLSRPNTYCGCILLGWFLLTINHVFRYRLVRLWINIDSDIIQYNQYDQENIKQLKQIRSVQR